MRLVSIEPDRQAGATTCSSTPPAVLYLISQYPALSHTFVKREILALERLGVRVVRVAARAGKALVDPGDAEEKERTIYLLRQPLGLLKGLVRCLFRAPLRFAKALATSFRMMRRSDRGPFLHLVYLIEACGVVSLARTTGALHIHAHFGTNPAEVALLASQLSGLTYSVTVHGCDEFDKPEFIGLREKIRGAAFVVAVSYYGRSQLYRWCDDVDRDKIKLIRCGLEREFHDVPEEAPSELARFVCVGRLCRLKGYDVFLEAAAAMAAAGHEFEAVIVGDGEARTELEKLIAALRLSGKVRLLGSLSSAGVRQQIIRARALVVPSLAENLPVVIMEAMALRRPVVATQIGGIAELVIPGKTGWLVPASSIEALTAALTECASQSPVELAAMGSRGRQRVLALHDVDKEATALADLFAENLARARGISAAQISAAVNDQYAPPETARQFGSVAR